MSEKKKCLHCHGNRIDLPYDKTASDFRPTFADIESDSDGHCLSIGTPAGNVFLIIKCCPECGREL